MIMLDYILLGIILILALLGLKKGFLESLGSIVGLIAAAILASRFYPDVGAWFGGSNFSHVIAFVLIFLIAVKIVSLLFWALGKIFRVVTVLPFVSSFDRLLGFILGMVEGIFILAIVLYFLTKYPVNDWLLWQMSISVVSDTLLTIGLIFMPLFPEALKMLG